MGPATRWLLNPETTSGTVQSLDDYDITGDGVKDLIVGRHVGNVDVYFIVLTHHQMDRHNLILLVK